MNDLTLTISPTIGVYLLESIDWSITATENALIRNPNNTRNRQKWEALNDLAGQIQEAKAEWFGEGEIE